MTNTPEQTTDNPYYHDYVDEHVFALLNSHKKSEIQDSVHLDIGYGCARIAESLIGSLEVQYVGIVDDKLDLKSGRDLNFEIHKFNFCVRNDSIYETLKSIVGNRHLHSVSLVNIIGRLTNIEEFLSAVQQLAIEYVALIIISEPNITHSDIGFKLAFGKWDYINTDLLDRKNVSLFSRELLVNILLSCGLYTVDSYDIKKKQSDQCFPVDHPALSSGTLLNEHLQALRHEIDKDWNVVQFVQLCVPGPKSKKFSYITTHEQHRPFLSIIIRTQGLRLHTLSEVLTSLAAQTDSDFDVLVMAHLISLKRQKLVDRIINDTPLWLRKKIRVISVDEGNRTRPLNIGFEAASGHYISILDDDDMPGANWVETFRELSLVKPGRMLRSVAVRQDVENVIINGQNGLRAVGPLEKKYPSTFDLLDHLRENFTPPVAIAFPREVFHKFNMHFDETLTTTEDWDYIMRVAGLVGVVSSEKITAIYRWWVKDNSSRIAHPQDEWDQNYLNIIRKMDNMMMLYPKGTTKRIRMLLEENDNLKYRIQMLDSASNDVLRNDFINRINYVIESKSWFITMPLRLAGRLLGKERIRTELISQVSSVELETFYQKLLLTRSWRITRPLRMIRKKFFD